MNERYPRISPSCDAFICHRCNCVVHKHVSARVCLRAAVRKCSCLHTPHLTKGSCQRSLIQPFKGKVTYSSSNIDTAWCSQRPGGEAQTGHGRWRLGNTGEEMLGLPPPPDDARHKGYGKIDSNQSLNTCDVVPSKEQGLALFGN